MIELKCEVAEQRDSYIEEGEDSTFYRYDIDGTKVWFVQYDNGNIYSVYVKQCERLGDIKINIFTDKCYPYIYYPYGCSVVFPSFTITKDCEFGYCIELIEYIQKVSKAIMNIFDLDLHKNARMDG